MAINKIDIFAPMHSLGISLEIIRYDIIEAIIKDFFAPVSSNLDLLRLNVGFIIHQNVGFSRDFPFEIPSIYLPPDLDLRKLSGIVRVTRATQGLLVQIRMRARVVAECVRCLNKFYQPLKIESTELYAFSLNSVTDSGLLVPENGKIDLAPIIREEMLVAIPISPLCKQDCKGLCPICGEDLNETACNHDEEQIDPRLGVLKSLLVDEQDTASD